MLNRRDFLKLSAASFGALFAASRTRFVSRVLGAATPQMRLPGTAIPQFVDPVPNLLDSDHLIVDDGVNTITLEMREHMVNILPAGTVPGYAGTYVWSYLRQNQQTRTSYLGPVVVATRGIPTEMKVINLLGNADATNVLAYRYSTDQTLHWADPLHDGMNMWNHMAMPPEYGSEGAENYLGSIPAVVHLHGGEVPPQLDGGPDAWMTSDGLHQGAGFYSRDGAAATNYHIYRYPNCQEGALIWFHDHTLGATRLNVYAGLAGGYLISDPNNDPPNLPPLFPLVIQDRMFDTNGQLFFTAGDDGDDEEWALNPEHPYWNPEFVGDTIVVNGKSWPYMNVEPKRYTFMFINGSNARTYELFLTDPVSKNPGPPLWVIGTDGGYLDAPTKISPTAPKPESTRLTMMSGERYWVIVDFKGYEAGKIGPNGSPYSGKWMLKNTAKTPYPGGETPTQNTTDRIIQFRVSGGPVNDTSYNPASGAPLRTPMVRLTGAAIQKQRQLTLNEVMGMPINAVDPITGLPTAFPGGPLEILVNNTKWDGMRVNGVDQDSGMYTFETRPDFTLDSTGQNYLSEFPKEGETELWEIINLTADAHPIHLHLVQFQLLNRQNFDVNKYGEAYEAAFPGGGFDPMTGQPYPPGEYIPAFGPPLNYGTGAIVGGNPDINAVNDKKRSLYLQGLPKPPAAHETGWKDTVITLPGQVTRILVRWAPTDIPANTPPAQANFPFDPNGGNGYVWHCHIVDHEDNEMMRPDEVIPNPVACTYVKGIDY